MKVGIKGHILLPNLRLSMFVCVSISVCEKIYFIYNFIYEFSLVGMKARRIYRGDVKIFTVSKCNVFF